MVNEGGAQQCSKLSLPFCTLISQGFSVYWVEDQSNLFFLFSSLTELRDNFYPNEDVFALQEFSICVKFLSGFTDIFFKFWISDKINQGSGSFFYS